MHNYGEIVPSVYRYWPSKAEFLLHCDTSKFWTAFVVEAGSFTYGVGEHNGEAGQGDIVLCPPDKPFYRSVIAPLTFHFLQFVWNVLSPVHIGKELSGKFTVDDQERLASNCHYLRTAGMTNFGSGAKEELRQRQIRHYANDIWLLVEQEQGWLQDAQEVDACMEEAMLWLLGKLHEPFRMRELSDWLGISPVQLTRRFRAAYGVAPSVYVTEQRLGRACRLLEETTLTLEEIAVRCGYDNGFYLSRIFRARKGITASAYRRLHQV